MIKCKLKPLDVNICMDCIDRQIESGRCENCDICPKVEECELLQIFTDIFGRDRAIVVIGTNRILKRVSIRRIFDVREKENVV